MLKYVPYSICGLISSWGLCDGNVSHFSSNRETRLASRLMHSQLEEISYRDRRKQFLGSPGTETGIGPLTLRDRRGELTLIRPAWFSTSGRRRAVDEGRADGRKRLKERLAQLIRQGPDSDPGKYDTKRE